MTSPSLRGISSMATRQLLADLGRLYTRVTGLRLDWLSVGGVDAARQVHAGEYFDVVVLAAEAIDALIASGHLRADSRRALADSSVAIAVAAGATRPDIDSEAALQQVLLASHRIGYSTGPSGSALLRLFERWQLSASLGPRLVQARPGVPVGRLIADGQVDIGFQQLSELSELDGVAVLGGLPPGLEIRTTFVGAVTVKAKQAEAAGALLEFLAAPEQAALKKRHGMEPPARA